MPLAELAQLTFNVSAGRMPMLEGLRFVILTLVAIVAILAASIAVWTDVATYATTLLTVLVAYAGVVSLLLWGDAHAWPRRVLIAVWDGIASTVRRAQVTTVVLVTIVVGLAVVAYGLRYEPLEGMVLFPQDTAKEPVRVVIRPFDRPEVALETTNSFRTPLLRHERVMVNAKSEHYEMSTWIEAVPGRQVALTLQRRNAGTSQPPVVEPIPAVAEPKPQVPSHPAAPHGAATTVRAPITTDVRWNAVHGNWHFDGRNATQSEEDAHPGLAIVTGTEGASELTCDARRTSGTDGFSVIVSYERENLAAWWDIGGYGGAKSIAEFSLPDSGVFYLPQTDKAFVIESGTWYAIHLERRGTHVRGTVNGALMLDFDIPDRIGPRGRFGFHTWSSRMEFRNIVVR